jgi:hypothetical protein
MRLRGCEAGGSTACDWCFAAIPSSDRGKSTIWWRIVSSLSPLDGGSFAECRVARVTGLAPDWHPDCSSGFTVRTDVVRRIGAIVVRRFVLVGVAVIGAWNWWQ